MAKARPSSPTHFYGKKLPGEEALTLATAEHLFRLASEIFGQQPWKLMTEDMLVFSMVDEDRLAIISVMGARGEFFSVMTYFGAEGFQLFQRMSAADEDSDPLELYAERSSVHVEYVVSSELEKEDKEMLRALGHPATGKLYAPVFRSTRSGYMPWPVNEQEGQTLAQALAALVVFLNYARNGAKQSPWEKGRYPLVVLEGGWRTPQLRAAISAADAPAPVKKAAVVSAFDAAKVEKLLAGNLLLGGPWEMDLFAAPMPVGGGKSRPFFARCLMAVDKGAGAVLHMNVFEPGKQATELLADSLLAAIEESHVIPDRIHVSKPEYVTALKGVCKALDCEVKFSRKLPALEKARRGMMEFVQGRVR